MADSIKAAQAMGAGYNCAQAVSTTYGLQFGVPEEAIARIASAFGGGIGRTDNICGAVSGEVSCTGLLGYNMSIPGEREKAVASNAFVKCRDIVRNAGALLEEFLTRE